jgi:hypothetical protein
MGIGLGDAHTPGELAVRVSAGRVVQRPHLEVIDDAFVRLRAGEVDRIGIITPPQVGKSERGAVAAPFWWLSHRPRDRIVCVSYADPLAVRRGRDVRKLVREHGIAYGLELDRESKGVRDWHLSSGGGMRCAGIGGSITGMACDLAIVDDPHKNRAEADSPDMRDKVWDFYSGDLYSRLAPGAPIIVIQTRWHLDDLLGRLIKKEGKIEDGGRWLILHMPAIANPARYGPDPLGRVSGDPLPHPRLAVLDVAGALAHWKDKREGSRARDWAALYQGDPIPSEGALTTEAILERQRVAEMPCEPAIVAVALDPSGEGRDVAGIVAGALGEDGHLYWTHDVSGEMQVDTWARAACELAVEINADRIIYEANYGKGMVRYALKTAWDALRREWLEENAGTEPDAQQRPVAHERWAADAARCPYGAAMPRLVEQVSKRGKWLRAEPVAQQLAEARVWLVGSMPELEGEWLEWQPTSTFSPGRIDASVHLTLNLLRPPGTDMVVSNPAGRGPSGASPVHRRRLR